MPESDENNLKSESEPDYSKFAVKDSDARLRSIRALDADPFPDICPALLNAQDVLDYVRITGMLHPFDLGPKRMKAASYEACVGGDCKYWDEAGNPHTVDLTPGSGKSMTLQPNSIAFFTVEPYVRLPHYIGIRFNLKIRHVHRGLLLGTGPLVDPGYHGRLYIPVHNLTTNVYEFKAGDSLIWIEFTKVSRNNSWHSKWDDQVEVSRLEETYDFKKMRSRTTFNAHLSNRFSRRRLPIVQYEVQFQTQF